MVGIRRLLILLWIAGLGLIWPLKAPADWINGGNDTVWGSGMIYVPPADLTGWFFSSDAPAAFPAAPDPSQPWTSAANIATLNYWLGVVSDLGDASAMLDQVDAATAQALTDAQTQPETPSGTPEPAASALLSAGLLGICFFAVSRARRIGRYP